MRGDIDLRELDLKKLRVSRRTLIIVGTALAVATGGYFAWRSITNPPRPWLVRWKLDRYLAKQAGTGDFKVDFPFPSKAEMAKSQKSNEDDKEPARGSRTGKNFETLREEYLAQKTAALALQREIVRSEANLKDAKARVETLKRQATDQNNLGATTSNAQASITLSADQIATWEKAASRRSELQEKENALLPIVDDLWEFQQAWIADASASAAGGSNSLAKARVQLIKDEQEKLNKASSYEVMYQAIAQELFVARGLLESGNREHRREGVTVALTAARHSIGYAMNGFVAARICEGYVLPNLDLATDRNTRSTFNEENLLGQCADIFRRNEEPKNVVRVYELYLDNIKNPARADWARSQIAMASEQAGDPHGALAAWREIKDTNSFRFLARRVARWEQDAKAQ